MPRLVMTTTLHDDLQKIGEYEYFLQLITHPAVKAAQADDLVIFRMRPIGYTILNGNLEVTESFTAYPSRKGPMEIPENAVVEDGNSWQIWFKNGTFFYPHED
jgi:hypothetical protein